MLTPRLFFDYYRNSVRIAMDVERKYEG